MIKVTENLWIGGEYDEKHAPVDTVLNVALDLKPTRIYTQGIEYAHLGLVDGPGNPTIEYIVAAVVLVALVTKRRKVLVCCHGGWSRSAAVVVMHMNLVRGGHSSWSDCLEVLNERLDADHPEPHSAHKEAFNKIRWDLLSKVITGAK